MADAMDADVDFDVHPSYNISPGTFQPVIRLNDEGRRGASMLWWELIPFWATDKKISYTLVNARCETVATKASFRDALKKRRCLVPAEWFYEWKNLDSKTKQPYAISMKDGSIFAFAGLWESWDDEAANETLESFSIISTDANELITGMDIHPRMPVILKRSEYDRWLSPCDPQQVPVDLLRPYDADKMKAWRVGQAVGNVRNNDPTLIEQLKDDGRVQLGMFVN